MNDLLEYAKRSAAHTGRGETVRGVKPTATDGFPTAMGPGMRRNRKVKPRRVSTFHVITVLFLAGVAIVLYVNNVLTVNRLAYEVKELQTRLDSLSNVNEGLRAELSKRAAPDRIGALASESLKMQNLPVDRPAVALRIEPDKLEQLRGK